MSEKYELLCPKCGRVEGYVGSDIEEPDDADSPSSDEEISVEEVQTSHGPTTRVRCPRCGQWIRADRERPL